jgi:magnesium transporter
MARRNKRPAEQVGLPPGTLVHIGERKSDHVEITVLDYDARELREYRPASIEECAPLVASDTVSWIDVAGLHDVSVIEAVGKTFNIHPLVLEDVANTGQRPKFEDFGSYCFFALKMLYYDPEQREIVAEQVSLILGSNFVVSFQETPKGVFELIRERLRGGRGRIREMGGDYLVYSIADAIIDNYFLILEKFGENTEVIEDRLVSEPSPALLREIHRLKRETLFFRRCAWPLRDMISAVSRGESPLIREGTAIYLRDLYDHAVQIIDTVEGFRETVSGMLDVYLSSASNRMNEVMKVLTIMASIFIPLTFVAGVYGMNFKHMPELERVWAYPASLVLMLAMAAAMVAYFKRKGWL